MGKKVKKKTRAPQKEKWVPSDSPKKVAEQSNPSVKDDGDDGVSVAKVRKACPHIDKGVDLNKLQAKIGSSAVIRCEDCREGAIDRKGGKGKGKHGKKKGGADSKSESKSVWLCLECGHFACGGIGLPITPQCHAVRHARQTRHPLVVQFENPQLRWCFQCSTLITIDKTGENGEEKDVFSDVVKLIKGHSSEDPSGDVEDVWFGSGSVTSEIKSASNTSSLLDGRGGYAVRGLVNLGNTCFFNSILQNLLAIDRLRVYFLNFEAPAGPLTISLKKLFTETKPEAGFKNVINPRSFFGCVCSKAPQFRGYQQQDSHELLRCLLDGLCTEELSMRKRTSSSQQNEDSSNPVPTFVDAVFGGQVSSTVRCVECGHSSTIYESFLDLSLPVPTRKSPPKASLPSSRAKKTKLPPKRSGKVRSKINKDKNSATSPSVATTSTSGELSNQVQSSSTELNVPEQNGLVMKNLSAVQESQHEQVFENAAGEQASALLDDFTWMDYLDDGNILDDYDLTSENAIVSIVQDPKSINTSLNDVSQQSGSEISDKDFKVTGEQNVKPNFSSVNAEEDELPLQVQSSEILLLPYKEDQSSEMLLLPHKEGCSITGEIMGGEGEASSSTVGCGQDDFDGFGDLFNEPEPEPEVVAGPSPRPSTGEEGTATSLIASESDPDEVDDTNSPVSVESCLAHFIKPELLANENAWHCENCSKSLKRQRLEAKKQQKAATKCLINGCETRVQSVSLSSDTADISNISNGNIKSNTGCSQFGENLVLDDGKMNCSSENCTSIENALSDKMIPVVCQQLEGNSEMKDVLPTESNTLDCNNSDTLESISSQAIDTCADVPSCAGCASENAPQTNSTLLDDCELEASEDEEINSKHVKVKRDATKRVLIDRAPPILTIHLKRFSQDARGRLSKLNGHVTFREKIELRPYMDSRCREKERYEYHLIGVVEHSGTMRGGHYVAYVRGGERSRGKAEKEKIGHVWYYASDVHVREVSLDEVLRCEAYILFYEKT
ncbi:putative ubiquitinyl hydrolase 1 [Rosa chinensis]|uniref:ubiquitinyl hydrolase 1 n=1 Tax=Rosa chinensis TaxID=74649 RepID=A0A2P6QWH6_ROSCH|nr:ubiquitin carboxyl-terminal hydrolase 2 [Rosa chinensis]XP_040373672.1 ubiquitin carboxyl-terminal hydrolase 2 [Rosa chinensis]PRQ38548.1 putative ubiquitinyl hydrolase 1 [Rosa chinensis]